MSPSSEPFTLMERQRNQRRWAAKPAHQARGWGSCTAYSFKGLYGYRKVFYALIQQGEQVSVHQVRKTLHSYLLQSKKPQPFKPNTTQSDPNHPVAPRIFKVGETLVTGLNHVWGSDITYLPTSHGGFLYLVIFIDFFSRKIVSWGLSSSLSAEFVLKAFIPIANDFSCNRGIENI